MAPLVAVVLPGEAAGTAAGVGVSPCGAGAGAIALAAASPAPTLVGMATGAFEAWEMALADMVVGVARAREQRRRARCELEADRGLRSLSVSTS